MTTSRDQIKIGSRVTIETKENQGTGRLTQGIVKKILTSSQTHPHGIKVKLDDDQVGRVKSVNSEQTPRPAPESFVDLDKKEIPKTEDAQNEFKEFYSYDPNLEPLQTDRKKTRMP